MLRSFYFIITIAIVVATIFSMASCHKDILSTSNDIPLRFSSDTLRFDTVFTSIGSATRLIKVFNDQEEAVLIDDIHISEGASSFFRLNVDGLTEYQNKSFRIEANDSIYIFAEVTIDPDQPLSASPFFIENHLLMNSNDKSYTVWLEAWGQNANYLPSKSSRSQVNYISCDFGTWEWNDPKPYVIYGALLIDSCDIVVPEGTQIYVHGGIAINELGIYNDGLLYILSDASLTINGTAELPVSIQTDRLEQEFDQLKGQWTGIILGAGSQGNVLKHTTIKNSILGISVDSTASLRAESCTFAYTSGDGLRATHSNIYAQNCLFFENGSYGINLNFGGNYVFNFCTVFNTNNQLTALNMNNLKCTDPLCAGEILYNGLNAQFTNCMFLGNDNDEINMLDAFGGTDPALFNYNFSHSIVSVDELLEAENFPNFFDRCNNCLNLSSLDSIFIDYDAFNFRLDTMSLAIDKGISIPPINTDLEGNPRDSKPDIGCYEFQD